MCWGLRDYLTVSGGQIFQDESFLGQVVHPISHLASHVGEILHPKHCPTHGRHIGDRRLPVHQELVQIQTHGPNGLQKLLQRPVVQVLVDHVQRLLFGAHPEEGYHVSMAEAGSPGHLQSELLLELL